MKKNWKRYLLLGIAIFLLTISVAGAVLFIRIYLHPEIQIIGIDQEGDEISVVIEYKRLTGGLEDKRINVCWFNVWVGSWFFSFFLYCLYL